MSTSIINPANIKGYPVLNMNQNWCDDFDLAGANIDNAEASRDGDMVVDNSHPISAQGNGDALSSDDYCTHITDAQMDGDALAIYYDADDSDKNLVVANPNGGTGKKKVFCGLMGASASGQTNGTTVQHWTDWTKDMFRDICKWMLKKGQVILACTV